MEAALINPFVERTLHVLDTTVFVKVKPEAPFLKNNQN